MCACVLARGGWRLAGVVRRAGGPRRPPQAGRQAGRQQGVGARLARSEQGAPVNDLVDEWATQDVRLEIALGAGQAREICVIRDDLPVGETHVQFLSERR